VLATSVSTSTSAACLTLAEFGTVRRMSRMRSRFCAPPKKPSYIFF
jgi:hypothetical protein